MAAKISQINTEFDLGLLFKIIQKTILPIFILFIISSTIAFLYLRYTHPVFEASSVIQLSSSNSANKVLQTANIYDGENDISKTVELLKSKVFLKRVFSKLNFEVSYYIKGRILNFDVYRNTPFIIEQKVFNPSIYGINFDIEFKGNNKYILRYLLNEKLNIREFYFNETVKLPEMEFVLKLNPKSSIKTDLNADEYYFIINNPDLIVNEHINQIDVSILNVLAQTVLINVTNQNATKSADIANAIADEFILYDIERKAESANNILKFVDDQLGLVYDQLYKTESDLDMFKRMNKIPDRLTDMKSPPTYFSRVNDLQSQLLNIEVEEKMLEELEKNFSSIKDLDVYKLIAFISGTEVNKIVKGNLDAIQSILLQKEKMLYEITPDNRQINALEYQLGIQKKIMFETLKSYKSNMKKRKSQLDDMLDKYTRLDSEVDTSRGLRRYDVIEYSKLQRMYSINENFYNQLIQKKAEYSISKAGYVSQNTIFEYAITPSSPIAPSKKQVLLISFVIAFIISMAFVVVRYLLHNNIIAMIDIVKYTKIPILGIVPKYKKEIEWRFCSSLFFLSKEIV